MKIDNNTDYTVNISLTSTGLDPEVRTDVSFSHSFDELIMNGEQVPASVYLARDIGVMLNLMRSTAHLNTSDAELDAMNEDDALAAIEDAASTAEATVSVTRLK